MCYRKWNIIIIILLVCFSFSMNLFFIDSTSAVTPSADKKWEQFELNLEKIPAHYAAVECADIDYDGDIDLFVGNWKGFITYFENIGTPDSFLFKLKSIGSDRGNSFFNIYTLNKSVPRFIDIDNDNDLDLFIGDNTGNIAFYRNDGTIDSPKFVKVKSGKSANDSYFDINVGIAAAPFFVDIDNDDDYDLFVGNALGYIAFYRNDGSPESPKFSRIYGGKSKNDSFSKVKVYQYAVPVFTDINDDKKYDLFIGAFNGFVYYYKNIGTPAKYRFELITTKFAGVLAGGDSTPCFADIDNDGVDELIVGNNEGKIFAFKSPVSMKIVTSHAHVEKLKSKSKPADNTYDVRLNKAEKLIDEEDCIEALNVINTLPKSTDRSKKLKRKAGKELNKLYDKSKKDSLLFKEAEPYFKEAVGCYIKGEYEKSISKFDKVSLMVPYNKLSLRYKRRALHKIKVRKNEKQAKEFYEQAISKYEKKEIDNAYELIGKAKEVDPGNITYAGLFTKYSNECFEKSNKEFYSENMAEAKQLISIKKYNEANDVLLKLKDKFPGDKEVNNLIEICKKNSAAARRFYNQKMKEKYLKKGDEYFNKNDFKNALENYQQALRYKPGDSKIKEKINLAEIKKEKKEKRILDPKAVKSHYQNGMKYYSMGQYEKAVFEWKKVLELDPHHIMAKNNIKKAEKMLK